MSIIEQIRAEIERLKKEHQEPTFRGDEYEEGGVNGYQLALDKVLAKLDTLQEQPVDWQKVAEAHTKDQPLGQDNNGNLVYLQEQPVDLEKEIQKWMYDNCDSNGFFNQIELARHFAQWGAEHLKK